SRIGVVLTILLFTLSLCAFGDKPPASSGAIQHVTVHLTSQQIKSLIASPVTLVPGVAGQVIFVHNVVARYNYVAPAYTLPNGIDKFQLYFTSPLDIPVFSVGAGVFSGIFSAEWFFADQTSLTSGYGFGAQNYQVVGQDLKITITGSANELSDGNGSVDIDI